MWLLVARWGGSAGLGGELGGGTDLSDGFGPGDAKEGPLLGGSWQLGRRDLRGDLGKVGGGVLGGEISKVPGLGITTCSTQGMERVVIPRQVLSPRVWRSGWVQATE